MTGCFSAGAIFCTLCLASFGSPPAFPWFITLASSGSLSVARSFCLALSFSLLLACSPDLPVVPSSFCLSCDSHSTPCAFCCNLLVCLQATDGDGGAINLHSGTSTGTPNSVTLTGVRLVRNTAAGSAGAMKVFGSRSLTVQDLEVADNSVSEAVAAA